MYGIPVVFGPKWQKFREARGLLDAGAAFSVNNYNQFSAALDEAFVRKEEMGDAAAEYVAKESGASKIIYDALFNNTTSL